MTSSNGNIFRVTGPLCGEFPSQRPVTRSFDVFVDLSLNKLLSKQSRRRWFETSSRSLWRHCNAIGKFPTFRRHKMTDLGRCWLRHLLVVWWQFHRKCTCIRYLSLIWVCKVIYLRLQPHLPGASDVKLLQMWMDNTFNHILFTLNFLEKWGCNSSTVETLNGLMFGLYNL